MARLVLVRLTVAGHSSVLLSFFTLQIRLSENQGRNSRN
jgi:hypothetical protein